MEDAVYFAVKNFTDFLKNKLDETIEKGEIEIINLSQEVFRWEINDFNYSVEKGIASNGAVGHHDAINTPVFINKVDEQIKVTKEYKELIEELSRLIESKNLENKIIRFVQKISSTYLSEKTISENFLSTFVKELKGEPIKMWAYADLFGLTLEPEKIQINSEISILKPTKDYLEEEKIISLFNQDAMSLDYPSAILKIEIFGKSPADLQKHIERTITILRLFGSGGVKYIKYQMFSEATINLVGGTVRPWDKSKSSESYQVNNKDVLKLSKFFEEMLSILPLGLETSKNLDDNLNLGFSYERYTEAIINNELIEKRIVNTISGLESLYSNSPQELSRHLRLNVSKVMELFGYDPYEVRGKIKDSYDIRSKFIHGNHLDYSTKKGFIEKHSSLESLFSYVVNYLRISIILFLALKMEKDQFIDLLEDILIDNRKEQNFKIQIENIKERFCL